MNMTFSFLNGPKFRNPNLAHDNPWNFLTFRIWDVLVGVLASELPDQEGLVSRGWDEHIRVNWAAGDLRDPSLVVFEGAPQRHNFGAHDWSGFLDCSRVFSKTDKCTSVKETYLGLLFQQTSRNWWTLIEGAPCFVDRRFCHLSRLCLCLSWNGGLVEWIFYYRQKLQREVLDSVRECLPFG